MNRRLDQELASTCQYEPLPSLPEAELPDLVGGESYEWAAISDLDAFFKRLYRYWHDKGMLCILVGRLLNLAALGFTIAFSGFLLLAVNWSAIHAECLMPHQRTHGCDLLAVAIHKHPLRDHSGALVALVGCYLVLCLLYWLWSVLQLAAELRGMMEVKHFINNKLGISDRQVRMMTWSELLHRVVLVQRTTRLCAARDLDELDIVGRIMRKENYLIGMLNAGVLGLYVKGLGPLGGRRFMLTKTLEWNLYLCVLDPMFDEHFRIKQSWVMDDEKLRQRLRRAALINLVLAPFLLMFLVIYFFMKHAERFYHSPGSLGSRRWSSLAKWKLRELNELPHYVQHRLDASYEAAVKYVGQFPSPLISQVAKFVSFVAGSFAALLLGLSLLDENLLEVPLGGRNLVWWLALTGILLTISRTFINDTPVAFDPERAMAELVLHTHYLPRHWRGRAHSAEVQQAVNSMFTLKVLLFAEELASVVLTPFILAFSLPNCAGAILQYVRDTTTRVEGVGDVCSLAVFDFDRHGNAKYGAPANAHKRLRSKQGKMEKSFLTFVATYPTWQPPPACRQVLGAIGSVSAADGGPAVPPGPGFNSYQAAPGFSSSPAAGAGACAGLGAAANDAGVGSVFWQQPYSSSNSRAPLGAAGSPRAPAGGPGQQSAAPSGTSSVWVGVAEAPTGLRHPNHVRHLPQQQQQQQRAVVSPYQPLASPRGLQQAPGTLVVPHSSWQQQQQQQQSSPLSQQRYQQHLDLQQQEKRRQDEAGGMGAGLGGPDSTNSPVGECAVEQETARLLQQLSGTGALHHRQQGCTDGFTDALFEPLSPTAGAGAPAKTAGTQQQQQQQQQQQAAWCTGRTPPAAQGSAQGHSAGLAAGTQQPQQLQAPPKHSQGHGRYQQLPQQQIPWHHHQQQQQVPWEHAQHMPPLPPQQQHHQMLLLQLSQFSSSLLPGMAGGRGPSGGGSVLQPYPSTLYPGGPSAAAALSHHLQSPPPLPPGPHPRHASAAGAPRNAPLGQLPAVQVAAAAPAAAPVGHVGHTIVSVLSPHPEQQQQQQQHQMLHAGMAGSMLAASVRVNSLAASDFLPMNEREDLSSRVAASHSLLQSYYESQDLSVQHRQANVAHARSVLLGQSGSAAAAAAAAAAMAAAASVRLEHM